MGSEITSLDYLGLSAILFTIGAAGVLIRKNPIVIFMCVELMLNAVNLTFIAFSSYFNRYEGQVFAFFVMTVAAAEVAVGLGIIVAIFRRRHSVQQAPALSFHGPARDAPVAVRADPLSMTMVLVVTGVGFLIHLYSIGYMEHDERYARYFTFLNLFTFAMLILVMANNYLLMFVGWEGVGLCSYLLIGFWFEKPSAAFAGKKAFLVNRVGDWGFIVGLLMIFGTFGTLTY